MLCICGVSGIVPTYGTAYTPTYGTAYAQASPGEPWGAQGSPDEPRRAQTSPEEHRRAQGSPGEPGEPNERPPQSQGIIDGAYVRSLRINDDVSV